MDRTAASVGLVATAAPAAVAAGSPAGPAAADDQDACTAGWHLSRNCAMRPRTFWLHLGAIAAVNAIVGIAVLAAGYWIITLFCLLQILALVGMALCYAIHAADGEHIELQGDRLAIRVDDGGCERRYSFNRCWTRLELGVPRARCFWLCSGRTRVRVGSHLDEARRRQAAREIAAALRRHA